MLPSSSPAVELEGAFSGAVSLVNFGKLIQTPTMLGVRTRRHKYIRYHGVWDFYELYDIENDPDEMNNLLAGYIQDSEGGILEAIIRKKAPEEVAKLFDDMTGRLNQLLKETGCLQEPAWIGSL